MHKDKGTDEDKLQKFLNDGMSVYLDYDSKQIIKKAFGY